MATLEKVPARSNPNPIDQTVLAEEGGLILVDDNEVAILLGVGRTGAGFEFEFNRQEEPES